MFLAYAVTHTPHEKDKNPFSYSDSNKRYYTSDYYLKSTFGGKCAKIPLDAGLSCPNIDGRCGVGGCIYCSGRGTPTGYHYWMKPCSLMGMHHSPSSILTSISLKKYWEPPIFTKSYSTEKPIVRSLTFFKHKTPKLYTPKLHCDIYQLLHKQHSTPPLAFIKITKQYLFGFILPI